MTAVVDVEVPEQTTEDAGTSTTIEGELPDQEKEEETPEIVEGELDEEGGGLEDDVGEEVKGTDEVEPETTVQEGEEEERVDTKSGSEGTKETV